MHFFNLVVCISSLLVATASASTSVSFEIPGTGSSTPVPPEVDTTTVWETSTHYLTSAVTLTSVPVASVSSSDTPHTSAGVSSSCSEDLPPFETIPSLYVSGSQTLVPVTLWESSTTRVIYPQNSTALPLPTGYPVNGTVVITSSGFASKTASTPGDKTSSSASTTASFSEVPINSANKVAGNMLVGMGAVAGFMALL